MNLTTTIIIPTHMRYARLEQAVNSAFTQSVLPDEIIIVHDGTGKISAEIEKKITALKIKYKLINRDQPSLTQNRNAGIEAATSQVVIFGEDDAIFDIDFIKTVHEIFEADKSNQIAAIGANVIEPHLQTKAGKIWTILSTICCQFRWRPRVCKARYVEFKNPMPGKIKPALKTSGAGLCLKLSAIKNARFNENLAGAGFGEDREFSFKLTRKCAVFYSPELKVTHTPEPGGRGNMQARGEIYIENLCEIYRTSTEQGVGQRMLMIWGFIGTFLLYVAFGFVGDRSNWSFAEGMLKKATHKIISKIRSAL